MGGPGEEAAAAVDEYLALLKRQVHSRLLKESRSMAEGRELDASSSPFSLPRDGR